MAAEHDKIKTEQSLLRFLHRQGRISVQNALNLEQVAADSSRSVIEVLDQEGVITQAELAALLAQTLRLPLVDLRGWTVDRQITAALKGSIAKRYDVVPLRVQERSIEVAMANPLELDAVRAVEFATGRRARVGVATQVEIRDALLRLYANSVPGDAEPEQPVNEPVAETRDNGHATASPASVQDEFIVAVSRADDIREARPPSGTARLQDPGPPLLIEEPDLECREAKDESHAYGEQVALQAAEALARADEAVRRVEALAAAARTPNAKTAEIVGRLSADCRALRKSAGDAEQRLAALAARQESSHAELQPLIEHLQQQSQQAVAEALTRAERALERVETLDTNARSYDTKTAESLDHLAADCQALRRSVGEIEERVAALAARQEDAAGAELQPLIEQVQKDSHRGVAEALARADEVMRRVQALAEAEPVPDAATAKLVGRLTADCHALSRSVRQVEQRLAAVAARQESSHAELQPMFEQVQLQAQQTAAAALARADDAVRLVESLATSTHAQDATTTELVGRLAAQYDALQSAAEQSERRLAELSARQEAFSATDIQPLIKDAHAAAQHLAAEARACGERAATQAAAAAARADEAIHRIEALGADGQARETNIAAAIGGLCRDYETLKRSLAQYEQQLAAVAARQEQSPDREWQAILDQVRLDTQQGIAQALARSDQMLQRLETLTTTVEANGASAADIVGRLTNDSSALRNSVADLERRLGAVAARQEASDAELPPLIAQAQLQSQRALAETATRVDEAFRRIDTVAAAARVPDPTIAKLTGRLAAECHTLTRSVRDIDQRLGALASRQESSRAELQPILEDLQRRSQQGIGEALARADDAVGRIQALAATSQTREDASVEVAERLGAESAALRRSLTDVEARLTALAAEQDASHAELQPVLRELQQQSQRGIAEALARADDAVGRIEALAAASQTREHASDELIARLGADTTALRSSFANAEERLGQLAAQQGTSGIEFRTLLEGLQRQSQQGIAEALARADDALRRIETLAAASQTGESANVELAERFGAESVALRSSFTKVEERLTALAAQQEASHAELSPALEQLRRELRQAITEAAARAEEAIRRVDTLAATASVPDAAVAKLSGRLAADAHALKRSLREIDQRLNTLAARLESSQTELPLLLEQIQRQSQHGVAAALERVDALAGQVRTLTAAAQTQDTGTAELLSRLSTEHDALKGSVTDLKARFAARQELSPAQLQPLLEEVQQRYKPAVAEALNRADEALGRIEALRTTAQAADDSNAELVHGVGAECEALRGSIAAIDQRLAALAVHQNSSTAELETVAERLQQFQATVAAALARADEAHQCIEALASQAVPDTTTTRLTAQMAADYHILERALRGVEQRLAALAVRQESSQPEIESLIEELRHQSGQGRGEMLARADAIGRRVEAVAGDAEALKKSIGDIEQRLATLTPRDEGLRQADLDALIDRVQSHAQRGVAEALARADDAVRRIDAVAAEAQSYNTSAGAVIRRLETEFVAFRSAAADVEQHVAAVAARQESSEAALQPTIEHLRVEWQRGMAEVAARADEALRRVESLAAAPRVPDAATAKLVGRLAAECRGFEHSMHTVEQRLTALAAQHESSRAELQPFIEQVQLESRQAVAALTLQAEEAARRVEALALTTRTHESNTDDRVQHLDARSDALSNALSDAAQRLATLASRQDSSDTALQPLIEQLRTESRQTLAAASRRADEAMDRTEALATATQVRDANTTERLDDLAARSDTLGNAVSGMEQHLATLAAQQRTTPHDDLQPVIEQMRLESQQSIAEACARGQQAATQAAQATARADEALRQIATLAAAAQARDAGAIELAGRLTADYDVLKVAVGAYEQRLAAVAPRAEASLRAQLQPMMERLQMECQQAAADARVCGQQAAVRAAEAAAQADQALRRLDELTTTLQAQAARTEDLTELQSTIDDLTQERADLEAQVQHTAARVARLNESLLALRGRVRPSNSAARNDSEARGRLHHLLTPARSQLQAAFVSGAAELIYRGSRVLRRLPDVLLIAGLILVATLVVYIGWIPKYSP